MVEPGMLIGFGEISTICAPKEHGGLGVQDPEKINIALGAKILCLGLRD
jgi:hypothetical protein